MGHAAFFVVARFDCLLYTSLSMISQLVGAVVNIILDPIFIFGYCGQALSGTTGAAVATLNFVIVKH